MDKLEHPELDDIDTLPFVLAAAPNGEIPPRAPSTILPVVTAALARLDRS